MIYEKHFKDQLPGGKGDEAVDSDFDPKEIEMGNAVELEHTKDKAVAKEITHDHLTEDPHYYSKLKKAGLADELKKEQSQSLSLYQPFFEFTSYDLRDRINQVIKGTLAKRKQIKGNVEKNAIVLVDFDATSGETTWLCEPTYKLSNTELDTQGKEKGPTTAYTVKVAFPDYREWFSSDADPRAEVAWRKLSTKEFQDFLQVADVKVHCTCPAFNFWGMRYQLTRADAALYPQTIPDPIRSKQTGAPRPSSCKHVIQVMNKMIRSPAMVLGEFKKKI